MKSHLSLLFLFVILNLPAKAQETRAHLTIDGYFSVVQSSMFDSLRGPFINENIIHNRLNINFYAGSHFTVAAGLRNRLFTGDMIRILPSYANSLASDQGWADLTWNLASAQSFIFNSTFDRLNLTFTSGNFQIVAGRQRINWGQTLVWNPNDIFNTWSFFDIDYPERPGSDAIRLQYFTSPEATAELAVKINSNKKATLAGLYRFNAGGYDIQVLAGLEDESEFVAGTGWSGSLGQISFRSESSLFIPYGVKSGRKGTIITTAGLDRSFPFNLTAQLQLMYCNEPLKLTDLTGLYERNISARELAFSRFTAFASLSWSPNPLLSFSPSLMWFPDIDGYYAGSGIEYSVAENTSLSLFYQHFRASYSGLVSDLNLGFLRIKISF